MRQVGIAELKAKLSEYLRLVRSGESVAVLDRKTAVAQLVPMREPTGLRIRMPVPGALPPNRVALPAPAKISIDIVDLLLEERQNQR